VFSEPTNTPSYSVTRRTLGLDNERSYLRGVFPSWKGGSLRSGALRSVFWACETTLVLQSLRCWKLVLIRSLNKGLFGRARERSDSGSAEDKVTKTLKANVRRSDASRYFVTLRRPPLPPLFLGEEAIGFARSSSCLRSDPKRFPLRKARVFFSFARTAKWLDRPYGHRFVLQRRALALRAASSRVFLGGRST